MGLAKTFDYYWNQQADPRTNDLPLIGSPYTIPVSLVVYLYFIFVWGPNFMRDRKPFDLKTFTKRYNIFQIVANSYIIYEFIQAGWFTTITPFCELPDYSYKPEPLRLARTMWMVTVLKYIDLVETFVFILRKKNNQVSFLHIYHHITTLLLSWICTKYAPVAMPSFCPFINCGVHVIMYTYYYLSTFGGKTREFTNKLKPALTIIQMTQLILLLLHLLGSLTPSCAVQRMPGIVGSLNIVINFVLFYNFYQEQYVKKGVHKKK